MQSFDPIATDNYSTRWGRGNFCPRRAGVAADIDLPVVPSHDVLIIGAGLAGQRVVRAAAQSGASVAIVSKVHPVRSHSVAAAGGINAALNPEDTW